jgi:uncharacterized protein DUF6866
VISSRCSAGIYHQTGLKCLIMTFEIDSIRKTILHNCDISDAAHAGIYSVCTLALRLRDLFKWEKGLAPWEENEPKDTLEWIGEKEDKWEAIEETDFIPVSINGQTFDPFETEAINAVLMAHNLYYGAGYAHGLKPTFFLAVCEKSEKIHGITVHWLGREIARDLLTIPALTQDNSILYREQCARMFFWDQILYIHKSGRPALEFALKTCGIEDTHPSTIKVGFDKVFDTQVKGYIHHEVGEIKDTGFDRIIWREVISEFPHTPVEIIARVVKDVLADTNPYGTLPQIMKEKNATALGFYMAFRGSMAKVLFPDFEKNFWIFTKTTDWGEMSALVEALRNTARVYANTITEIFIEGKERQDLARARKEIERRFL